MPHLTLLESPGPTDVQRALAQQPRVLLLDEPTSHLDLSNCARVLAISRRLVALGVTIIFTTHDPDLAFRLADQVILSGGAWRRRAQPHLGGVKHGTMGTNRDRHRAVRQRQDDLLRTAGRGGARDVTGVLSPARFEGAGKVGIDVFDLRSGEQGALANLRSPEIAAQPEQASGLATIRWAFDSEVLAWGSQILARSTPCDQLVVDEVGPLEWLHGAGVGHGAGGGRYAFFCHRVGGGAAKSRRACAGTRA